MFIQFFKNTQLADFKFTNKLNIIRSYKLSFTCSENENYIIFIMLNSKYLELKEVLNFNYDNSNIILKELKLI